MTAIRALLVDDDEDDYVLTKDLLQDASHTDYDLVWRRNPTCVFEESFHDRFDVVLVDYRLGESCGLDTIRSAIEIGVTIPFILFTGENSVDIDREALHVGASDYLVKSQMTGPLLDRAIRYAIERKKVEAQLVQLAQFDSLTGLLNRVSFQTQLLSSIAQAKRIEEDWGLFLLDLDGFKSVNDTLGHPAGDELLRVVAGRLRRCLRDSDIVARLGGDEFCVIGPYLNSVEGASEVARKITEALKRPYHIHEHTVHVSASVGITMFCADGESAEQLMKNADLALYDAKRRARGGYRFFDEGMNENARVRETLGAALAYALDNGQISLNYQPKVEARTGFVVGVEALARWRHPEKGQISPDEFIPIAESTGVIGQLGDWVLKSACTQINEWRGRGLRPLPIAINLSSLQLKYGDFLDRVMRTIGDADVDPAMLEFELTESMIVEESESVARLIRGLKDLGVSFAIDDFGVGYSSLSYLMQFPVDKLKIDRSFVARVNQDRNAAAIARTIVALAKNLNLKIVAEGVESREQYEFFKGEGCDEVQGFYFCQPLDANALTDRYKARTILDVVQQSTLDAVSPWRTPGEAALARTAPASLP